MKFKFDDQLGHRGRHHMNLIASRMDNGEQVIFSFEGKSVGKAVTVLKEDYHKNGKWSHHTWEVELAPNTIGFVLSQDWGTGDWLNSRRWTEAINEFKGDRELDDQAVERFIRAEMPSTAARLDKNANLADDSKALNELLESQKKLAEAQKEIQLIVKEVETLEAAKRMEVEAKALKTRAEKAREMMKKGTDLAELKSLLGM